MTTLALLLAVGAAAQGPADAFRPPACATAAAAGWRVVSNPWLAARVPPGWDAADRLERWTPAPSTGAVARVAVYLDYSLRASTRPSVAFFGAHAPGRPRAAGVLADETLAHSAARGDDALGRGGAVPVPGLGECPLAVVELNARRACADKEAACRRASLLVDCGGKGGVEVSASALLPPYPERGRPEGKAARALAEFQAFACTLEFKGGPKLGP